jgi:hypothetical protein
MSATDGELATAGHARVICPDMRYSRWALLLFGAGLLLGLAAVSAGLTALDRVASIAMAGGIALLPVAVFADWRRRAKARKARRTPRRRRRSPVRGRAKPRRS